MSADRNWGWDEVRSGLAQLRDCGMRGPVYDHALKVTEVMAAFPAPHIWSLSEQSVVFDWETFVMTITRTRVTGLVSCSLDEAMETSE